MHIADTEVANRSKKYYFVQISTGESTWDTPTQAAAMVPTPGVTPAQGNPYSAPDAEGTRGIDGQGQEGDRSLAVSFNREHYIVRRRGGCTDTWDRAT